MEKGDEKNEETEKNREYERVCLEDWTATGVSPLSMVIGDALKSTTVTHAFPSFSQQVRFRVHGLLSGISCVLSEDGELAVAAGL